MFFYRYPLAIGVTLTILQPSLMVAQDISAVNNIAKNITVKIISQQGNGSGVIYTRTGNTFSGFVYSVVTNQHVVAEDGSYQIQTRDGTQHQVIEKQEITGLDLAIVQFKSNENYELASFGNSNEITEQQNISVAGFPDEQTDIDIVNGSIRSIKQGVVENPEAEQGYALIYTNQVLPGSSGGAVLDEQGNVIAINGQGTRDIKTGRDISRGIPINLFLAATNFSSSNYKLAYTIPGAFSTLFDYSFGSAKPSPLEVAENEVAISENKIVSNNGNTVKVWDLTTGELQQTLTGHSKIVEDIAVNRNQIVSISHDKTIKIWNLATGILERTLNIPDAGISNDLAVSGDKILNSSSFVSNIEVRNIATGVLERTVSTSNSNSNSNSNLFTDDFSSGTNSSSFDDLLSGTKSIAVDEEKIAGSLSGTDKTIEVWDLATGALEQTFPDAKADTIAINEGKVVSSGYLLNEENKFIEDYTIRVWDIATGELEHTLTDHTDRVNTVAISNGKVISGSKDKTIKVWNLATGELEHTLTGHTDSVTSVAVNENTIVSGSDDKTIKVWRSQN